MREAKKIRTIILCFNKILFCAQNIIFNNSLVSRYNGKLLEDFRVGEVSSFSVSVFPFNKDAIGWELFPTVTKTIDIGRREAYAKIS